MEKGGDPDFSRRGVRRRPEQGVKRLYCYADTAEPAV